MTKGSPYSTHDHNKQMANTGTDDAFFLLLSTEAAPLGFTELNMHSTMLLRVSTSTHVAWSDLNLPV